VSTALTHMKSGKLRTLGVSSTRRLTALPNLPAIAETVPATSFGGWQAIFTPAGTPQEIVARLHGGNTQAISAQEFKDYLFPGGLRSGGQHAGGACEFPAGRCGEEPRPDQERGHQAAIAWFIQELSNPGPTDS